MNYAVIYGQTQFALAQHRQRLWLISWATFAATALGTLVLVWLVAAWLRRRVGEQGASGGGVESIVQAILGDLPPCLNRAGPNRDKEREGATPLQAAEPGPAVL